MANNEIPQNATPSNAMLKVLIVDDEQFVRISLRALYDWERNGFTIVDTADNGLDALRKLEALAPDILITDIVMPGMDGLALLEQIAQRKLPVTTLVLSNLSDVESVKAALRLGAEDYYLKVNFDQAAFETVMHRLKAAAGRRQDSAPAPGPAGRGKAELAQALVGFVQGAGQGGNPGARPGLPPDLHVFCVRIKHAASQHLHDFPRLYGPLRTMVQEAFKAFPSLSMAQGPLPNMLLFAVADPIKPGHVMDLLKKLDAQMQIYLQASADILHFCAGGNPAALWEKLADLPAYLSEEGQGALLWDDAGSAPSGDPIDRALAYIHEHIDRRLSLSEIAAHIRLNPSYLSRTFGQRVGTPLIQYINERKMDKAALLLRSGNHKVKDVAEALGFDDPYYFTRLFNKTYGISPAEYMQTGGKGDA